MQRERDQVLYHYGIKGMHWGVRRWQNEDGSFNAAGKERYFSNGSDENYKPIGKESEAGGNSVKKSNRRLKLEEYYKSQGLNEQDAADRAYSRERTEKILKVVAGVAITAAVAYGAHQYIKNNVDFSISTNTLLSRVSTTNTAGVQDAFYAVLDKDKADVAKYAGLYADQIKNGVYGHQYGTDVYRKVLNATDEIKGASPKNAQKILGDLMSKDPEYLSQLKKLADNVPGAKYNIKIQTALETGKVNKSLYEFVNKELGAQAKNTDIARKFYSELSKNGYNAIKDVNDMKFSGFNTNNPLILFNTGEKIATKTVEKLQDQQISSQLIRANADNVKKAIMPKLGIMGVSVAAYKYSSKQKAEQEYVDSYRKEHPNSKLSYEEIVDIRNDSNK